MTTWPRRLLANGRLLRGPGLVAAAILAGTAVIAVVQQQEAMHRRDLVFEAQADRVRQEVVEAIAHEGERFRTAVDFVAVTHPGPIDQFQAFFERQARAVDELDSSLGFILVEQLDPIELEGLEARERALGNPDLDIRGIVTGEAERLIITRTAAPAGEGQLELRGLDVTGLQDQLPLTAPDSGYTLRVLRPNVGLRALLRIAGQPAEETGEGLAGLTTLANMIGPIPGPDGGTGPGERFGVAVRLTPVEMLLAPVDREVLSGLRASLLVSGVEGPVATLVGPEGESHGPVELEAELDLIADGQRWTLVITGGPGFGPPIGLFDNLGTWVFGLTSALLAAMALVVREWHGRRLVRTERELASALTVASTDGLTGLLNRVGFVQRSSVLDPTEAATVMFIDLDGFKAVNDLDGHEAGDLLLRAVADRLSEVTRPTDLLSRLGGDEFIVYIPGTDDRAVAAHVASRLIDAVDHVDERVSCSVGVAFRTAGDAVPVDELLRRADAAMYKVKRSGGRGYHLARSTIDDDPERSGSRSVPPTPPTMAGGH